MQPDGFCCRRPGPRMTSSLLPAAASSDRIARIGHPVIRRTHIFTTVLRRKGVRVRWEIPGKGSVALKKSTRRVMNNPAEIGEIVKLVLGRSLLFHSFLFMFLHLFLSYQTFQFTLFLQFTLFFMYVKSA